MTISLRDRIAASGREVAPKQVAEMIKYLNVPLAIVRYVGSEWKKPGEGQTRNWQLHTFCCPDGTQFSLGGCTALDTRLRACKVKDTLALSYEGLHKLDDTRSEHRWTVTLITERGGDLDSLIRECETCYVAIREAVAMKSAERKAGRATVGNDGAPPHTDADAPDGYAWN